MTLSLLLSTLLATGMAHAQAPASSQATLDTGPSHFGAGLQVGDPTGVSLAWRPTEWNAVEVGLGYDLLDGQFKSSADYLQSVAVIDPGPSVRIPVYIGLGAGVGSDLGMEMGGLRDTEEGRPDATTVAARVPIGASVLMMNAPVEIFAHVIPSLLVLPERQLGVDGALGVRYYF